MKKTYTPPPSFKCFFNLFFLLAFLGTTTQAYETIYYNTSNNYLCSTSTPSHPITQEDLLLSAKYASEHPCQWNNASMWVGGVVPGADNDVMIDGGTEDEITIAITGITVNLMSLFLKNKAILLITNGAKFVMEGTLEHYNTTSVQVYASDLEIVWGGYGYDSSTFIVNGMQAVVPEGYVTTSSHKVHFLNSSWDGSLFAPYFLGEQSFVRGLIWVDIQASIEYVGDEEMSILLRDYATMTVNGSFPIHDLSIGKQSIIFVSMLNCSIYNLTFEHESGLFISDSSQVYIQSDEGVPGNFEFTEGEITFHSEQKNAIYINTLTVTGNVTLISSAYLDIGGFQQEDDEQSCLQFAAPVQLTNTICTIRAAILSHMNLVNSNTTILQCAGQDYIYAAISLTNSNFSTNSVIVGGVTTVGTSYITAPWVGTGGHFYVGGPTTVDGNVNASISLSDQLFCTGIVESQGSLIIQVNNYPAVTSAAFAATSITLTLPGASHPSIWTWSGQVLLVDTKSLLHTSSVSSISLSASFGAVTNPTWETSLDYEKGLLYCKYRYLPKTGVILTAIIAGIFVLLIIAGCTRRCLKGDKHRDRSRYSYVPDPTSRGEGFEEGTRSSILYNKQEKGDDGWLDEGGHM